MDMSKFENQVDANKILRFINDNVIGKDLTFEGPYGTRKVVYCDFTASGRSLEFIEDYITGVVLPHYANTHTTTGILSTQTTMFREEARQIIRKSVNANDGHAVIFSGTGSTAGIYKLIHALKLTSPPIVFTSSYEHHSNILPWLEIQSKIIPAKLDAQGQIDLHQLELELQKHVAEGRPMIGSISAGSNITGVLTDVNAIAAVLHKYGALAFFDYAAAAPYVRIDMEVNADSYKDAVFISPHKFVGGPGSPGLLIARKELFRNPVPHVPAGGTVYMVSTVHHGYAADVETKEEGGTPDIIGAIRAGFVFQLKDNVKHQNIERQERLFLQMAKKRWSSCPNLIVLGPDTEEKLPIFSFLIKHKESDRYLHHNFVSALLHDLFGIQSRGGCMCAGPYGIGLLGITKDLITRLEGVVYKEGNEHSQLEILKPGYTRLNLPYFYEEHVIAYIIEAIALISEHGWKLLPLYMFSPTTSEWKCRESKDSNRVRRIGSLSLVEGLLKNPPNCPPQAKEMSLERVLNESECILLGSKKSPDNEMIGDQTHFFGKDGESGRWFLLPSEAEIYLTGEKPVSCEGYTAIFNPGDTVEEGYYDGSTSVFHYCACSRLQMNEVGKEHAKLTRTDKTNDDRIEEVAEMVNTALVGSRDATKVGGSQQAENLKSTACAIQ